MKVRVGLSGFSYKPWQGEGRFYPADLKQQEFLSYYAKRYDCVEMDGTWYRMPTEEAVQSWLANTPENFRFCFKAHRNITHVRRLKPEGYESLAFMLKRLAPVFKAGKAGPVLVQLPPNLKRDDERLSEFFSSAPKVQDGVPVRYAVEFRHESWNVPEVENILSLHEVAWAAVETDDAGPQKRATADFGYCRLRKSEYTRDELEKWASFFRTSGMEWSVFCKHEDEGSPWIWADSLLDMLSQQ